MKTPLRTTTSANIPSPSRALASAHHEARRSGLEVEEVVADAAAETERARERRAEQEEAASRGLSRRRLLGGAGLLAAAAAVPGALLSPSRANAATAPRVVVVGSGLAGMRAAHKLWNSATPIASTVYEADTSHIGGRCWSLRGFYAGGQVGEHGGSFVSSTDTTILNLAQSLGIQTEFENGGGLTTGNVLAWVNGPYTNFGNDLNTYLPAITNSYTAIGNTTPTYNNHNAAAQALDNMSCIDYMQSIGIDPNSPFGQNMQTIQLQAGGEPSDSSAIGLVSFWGSGAFGGSGFDELYHLKGGNDQLISGMLKQLPPGTVKQGCALVALARNSNGSYTCTFQVNGGGTVAVQADHVVLALPFRQLRNVDLSAAGFTPLKMLAIDTQGMGQNGKIVPQLTRKTWPAVNCNGITNTGPGDYQTSWDGSVDLGPTGSPALIVNFPGGNKARYGLTGCAHGPAPAADVSQFLAQVDRLIPGTSAAYNGLAWEDHWSIDPWHLGAYHYYRVGQYTAFAGYEAVQEGNVHFAGEHTDVVNMTLDSAALSGERVAGEVAAQV